MFGIVKTEQFKNAEFFSWAHQLFVDKSIFVKEKTEEGEKVKYKFGFEESFCESVYN
jgi:hypothetical protein